MNKVFSRLLGFVCVLALFFSAPSIAKANDLPIFSSWAEDEAQQAINLNLVPFYLTSYCDVPLDRNLSAALLVRLVEIICNSPIDGYTTDHFTDVDVNAYTDRADDVYKAFHIGIVNGTNDGTTFEPYRDVTREEFASMLYRTLQFLETELDLEILQEVDAYQEYQDSIDISVWAQDAIYSLSNTGLFLGTSNGYACPQDLITREQAIVLVYRSYEILTVALKFS